MLSAHCDGVMLYTQHQMRRQWRVQPASMSQKHSTVANDGHDSSQRPGQPTSLLREKCENCSNDTRELLLRLVHAVERLADAVENVETVPSITSTAAVRPPAPPAPVPPPPPPVQPSRVRANSAPRFPRVENDTVKPAVTVASFDDVLAELRERISANNRF